MVPQEAKKSVAVQLLNAVKLHPEKVRLPDGQDLADGILGTGPVLVVLAAGKGTRYGPEPKCIQPVNGKPLARHSIDAFRDVSPSPVVCVVGYCETDVIAALGGDNTYVRSQDFAGGTGLAAYEIFSIPRLGDMDPLLVITMGDRVVPSSIFRRILEKHRDGNREADLTFLTAEYEPPRNHGKGRVLRSTGGQVIRIVEERDLAIMHVDGGPQELADITEGNCPLYVIRAAKLRQHLEDVTNHNAQRQFYLTDIVETISAAGGEIRTVTVTTDDREYDLLCADVTRPQDLAIVEGTLARAGKLISTAEREVEEAAQAIVAGRHSGQVASIARQLQEIVTAVADQRLAFEPGRPVSIGISGGRVRIAFMHPDMARFFGPAWQMPIGAADADGGEQITILMQAACDGRISLFPTDSKFREHINSIPVDETRYPAAVSDWHEYERFGTHMSEAVLLSLGYFSDEEVERRRANGRPLPPASLWVSNSMRRPFALIENAIASVRTLRTGNLGAQVQKHLGPATFTGLRLVSTGNIPEGGFSSSSAVTVATQNAINALWEIGIPPDSLVHLACQAEYGTGVRAGSLDQATEQKGLLNQGTLMSSNPKDNYRVIDTFPVPADRFKIFFPYTVARDSAAWRWSCGTYGEAMGSGPLTTAETRKLTGKAAEIAAILTRLPLDEDFFQRIEEDLLADGLLEVANRAWICGILRQVPLLVNRADLMDRVMQNRDWYADQLMAVYGASPDAAWRTADSTLPSLFDGWRDPIVRRSGPNGVVNREEGVPLRAMLAYLFGEVAKNFYLVRHPDEWIEYVTLSQGGDRCFDIDPERLPDRAVMERPLAWERNLTGPDLLSTWLDRHQATPVDYNHGLDDESLDPDNPPEFHRLAGSSFFRGLALIDLAEAMLKRAFGADAVAVRVNAAGQGDYFQVHVDQQKAQPATVKAFLRSAFYRRFGLSPQPEFVEVCPGGGAVGLRLGGYDLLAQLIARLRCLSSGEV